MLIIFAGARHLAGLMSLADPVQLGARTLATSIGDGPLGYLAGSLGGRLVGSLGLAGLIGSLTHRRSRAEQQGEQEHRLREEVTAYLALDLRSYPLERKRLAQLLSRTVATRSSFARAALLLRDSSGALTVAGSAGMDDLTVGALDHWGALAAASLDAEARASAVFSNRVGASSFAVTLERRDATLGGVPVGSLGCARVFLTPIASSAGLLGVIAVSATPRQSLGLVSDEWQRRLLLEPIEALALRLGTELSEAVGAWRSGARRSGVHRSGAHRFGAHGAAQGPEGDEPRGRRIWERTPDRHRARGPLLQREGRASHVMTKLGKTTVLQMAPFLASQHRPKPPASLGSGLKPFGVWQRGHGGDGGTAVPVA